MRRIITLSILATALVALTACGSSRTPPPGAPGPDSTPVEPLPDATPQEPDRPTEPDPPVEPPTDDPDTDPDQIYTDVRNALDRSREVDASEIEIWVDRGTVYLSGWVKTATEREAALAAAEGVSGVTEVSSSGLQVRG